MNWFQDINAALTYIEDNIESNLKSDDIAIVAHCSKYHFLKMFTMLTGFTLGEYIRQRRLSLAAKDLSSTNLKIIDIAFKYGYETPEAFSKAFKRLHGVSPSIARKKGNTLKAIPPLSFQIIVKGENKMDYKIVKREGFKIVGRSKRVTAKDQENFQTIPKFWDEACANGLVKILNESSTPKDTTLGVCYDASQDQEDFSYMIGIEGDTIKGIEDYEVIEVPPCTWAVFDSIGPMPHAIQNVWGRIFSEWFPATKYEHAPAPELEVYLPGDPCAEDYKCEVWIPVIEK